MIKEYKIALLGHRLDSTNLGVDALTQSHLALLNAVGKRLDIRLLAHVYGGGEGLPVESFGSNLDVQQFPNPILPKKLFSNLFEVPKLFKGYVAAFDLSEGDSFAEIYGWKRAYINSMQKILAARAGIPVAVAPMTIGPFDKGIWRLLAARALGACTAVYARDHRSADLARSLGRDSVQLATDLAMALPYDRQEHASDQAGVAHVGLNVSGLLWSGGYAGKNDFGIYADYRETVMQLAQRLSEEAGVKVHLVPHVLAVESVEDDRLACEEVRTRYPSFVMAPQFSDSIEAKGYISGLDLFLGSRMHACIAAFSSGVPTLPLAYSMKFEGLFGSLGYKRTVDLRTANCEDILSALELALAERVQMKAEVVGAFSKAQALLAKYEETIQSILKGRLK